MRKVGLVVQQELFWQDSPGLRVGTGLPDLLHILIEFLLKWQSLLKVSRALHMGCHRDLCPR